MASTSSSVYTKLVSSLLFPLHEQLKKHDSVARRRELERSQWLRPDELRLLQLQRLNAMLARTRLHVPYYRDRLPALPLQSLAELATLPLLTKALIRANVEAMKSEQAGPLARYNTGGSSGEPLIFYIGKDRVSHDVASKWRATRWWGVDIGDPEMV
ncbi:MAG TPA: phenylacetate--CoA ligase family protein, partial [Burkholderiaceae bacterium]